MGLNVNVRGGTGAGRRKPLKPQPGVWTCLCWVGFKGFACVFDENGVYPEPLRRLKVNPGYLVRCPDCGVERPGG